MRVFLAVLVLIFSLQSWTRADDIRDFQIEGISIEDSLLDYVDADYINSNKKYFYENKEFYTVVLAVSDIVKNLKTFEQIQVTIKDNDKKYIIYSLAGKIYFEDNINECYKMLDDIGFEISDILKNIIKKKQKTGAQKHTADKTGESTYEGISFTLNSGDNLLVYCTDWSDKFDYIDNLKVQIRKFEYIEYLKKAQN